MTDQDLDGVLDFLRGAEQLKNTLRSGRTSNGRQESTAEHTWRLCLMILLFGHQYPDIDVLKLMKMCVIHDLGEAVNGDVPAVDQAGVGEKAEEERNDLVLLLRTLPSYLQEEILTLWDEYETASSHEAKLAKAFDKIETVLQHTQGKNSPDFDYGFNLDYGKVYTDYDELTSRLRRVIDADTEFLSRR